MKIAPSDAAILNASTKLQLAAWSLLRATAALHEDIKACIQRKSERKTKRR